MAKTEWEDILIAKGIIPDTEKEEGEAEDGVESVPPLKRSSSSSSSLSSSLDSEFEEEYRRKRLDELRQARPVGKYSDVYPISRQDYNREVTEESKAEDTDGVVLHLFKDGIVASTILKEYLISLAKSHPNTKFCAIQSDRCIENYPDRNVPTLLAYKQGQLVVQAVGWGRAVDWSVQGPEAENERDGHQLADLERFLSIKEILFVKK